MIDVLSIFENLNELTTWDGRGPLRLAEISQLDVPRAVWDHVHLEISLHYEWIADTRITIDRNNGIWRLQALRSECTAYLCKVREILLAWESTFQSCVRLRTTIADPLRIEVATRLSGSRRS